MYQGGELVSTGKLKQKLQVELQNSLKAGK